MNVQNKEEARKVMMKYRFNICDLTLTIFALFLFSISIQASESVVNEVTIDSPPEVIAEDFVNVAIWDDPKTDNEPLVIRKWTQPIVITLPSDEVIQKQAKKIIVELNQIPNLNLRISNNYNQANARIELYGLHSDLDPDWAYAKLKPGANYHYVDSCSTSEDRKQEDQYIYSCWHLSSDWNLVFKLPNIYDEELDRDRINYTSYAKNIFNRDDVSIANFGLGARDISVNLDNYKSQKSDAYPLNVGGRIFSNYNYENSFGECFIWQGHKKIIKQELVAECLLRLVGLLGETKSIDNILGGKIGNYVIVTPDISEAPADSQTYIRWKSNEPSWIDMPTMYDFYMTRILYDKKIKVGGTRKDVGEYLEDLIKKHRKK